MENKPLLSSYRLRKDDRVVCPSCRYTHMTLLISKHHDVMLPRFYVCFECGYVGEVGVGMVPRGR